MWPEQKCSGHIFSELFRGADFVTLCAHDTFRARFMRARAETMNT
jgi:hypothetical protein